jgi:hypothetical protein
LGLNDPSFISNIFLISAVFYVLASVYSHASIPTKVSPILRGTSLISPEASFDPSNMATTITTDAISAISLLHERSMNLYQKFDDVPTRDRYFLIFRKLEERTPLI